MQKFRLIIGEPCARQEEGKGRRCCPDEWSGFRPVTKFEGGEMDFVTNRCWDSG